jgi:hypothetical protein
MKTSMPAWCWHLLPAAAAADLLPQPGDAEASRARLIRWAGYDCADPVKLSDASSDQRQSYGEKGLEVTIARCSDGKTYLVAAPPPRRGRPQPAEAGPAPPEPVVVPVP